MSQMTSVNQSAPLGRLPKPLFFFAIHPCDGGSNEKKMMDRTVRSNRAAAAVRDG